MNVIIGKFDLETTIPENLEKLRNEFMFQSSPETSGEYSGYYLGAEHEKIEEISKNGGELKDAFLCFVDKGIMDYLKL